MSSESYFKVPKEKDFLKIIEDAEDAGVLDKAATAVNNPLSWLRFIPGLGVNAFPIKIPNKIAIRTVEIGLFEVPKISIANTLFIPWENKQNTRASMTPGKIFFIFSFCINASF